MKIIIYSGIIIINFVLLGCTSFQTQNPVTNAPNSAQKNATPVGLSESYSDTLKSLLSRHKYNVRPKPSARDINLIDAEKGAAGMFFGESMDAVVAIWGKPSGLWIEGSDDIWQLEIGACDFAFIDNSLVGVEIHSATLDAAYFENGISFTSSVEEVKSAFGKPSEETKYGLEYYTENDYFIDFHFIPTKANDGAPELINISIYHPDAGK